MKEIQFKSKISGTMTADELRRLYGALDLIDKPFDLHVSKVKESKGHWLAVLRYNGPDLHFNDIWIFAKNGEL